MNKSGKINLKWQNARQWLYNKWNCDLTEIRGSLCSTDNVLCVDLSPTELLCLLWEISSTLMIWTFF